MQPTFSTDYVPAVRHKSAMVSMGSARYAELVFRIQAGESTALEELYAMVKNFTYFLMRQLGQQDTHDQLHDIFVTVAQAISAGKLRDPERLVPFLTTVTRFYTYGEIQRRVQTRRKIVEGLEHVHVADSRVNLELSAWRKQKANIVNAVLHAMHKNDREVLQRFYLHNETKEHICKAMGLTPTQFRLLKSKAKSEFTRLGLKYQTGSIPKVFRQGSEPAYAA